MSAVWWQHVTTVFFSQPPRTRRRLSRRRDHGRSQPACIACLEQRDLLAGFTPGNVIVNTIGTGDTLGAAATPVALREYGVDNLDAPTTATLVNTLAAPSSKSGNNSGNLTDSITAPSPGGINLSTDGSRISMVGYDAPAGLANVTTSTSTENNRVVGTVSANGELILDRYADAYSGSGIRAAVSSSATSHWMVGGTGVRYGSGGTSVNVVTNTAARFVTIVTDATGNQLLAGNSGASVFVWTLPGSLPTGNVSPQPVSLPNLGGDLGEVVMLDRSPTVAAPLMGGIDTIYVTNGQASTVNAGVTKYEWGGSSWILRRTQTFGNGLNGLAARITATNDVQLFATTRTGTGNNQLLTKTDTAGFGRDLSSGAFTVLASAGDGFAFRGIAFAPDEVTESTLTLNAPGVVNAGGVPVTLISDVTYANGSSFKGGSLEITGGKIGDTFSIADINGQITTSGNNVLYDGAPIGIVSGGTGTTALRVDFNARNNPNDVTTSMVSQLLKQIQVATMSTDSTRNLTVTLSQAGNHKSVIDSSTASIAITINQAPPTNQAPTGIVFANATFNLLENTTTTTSGRKVADVVVLDDGIGTNDLTLSGTNVDFFELRGTELWLKDGVSLNYEAQPTYDVTVAVDDSTVGMQPDATVAFQLVLQDVNEAPTIVLQNAVTQLLETALSPSARKMADIVVEDDALGTETINLNGPDAELFDLIGTELFLKAGTIFDFETKPNYTVRIDVDDADINGSPDASATLNLQIFDIYEPPEIRVTVDAINVPDNSTVNFGSVATGSVITRVFTVTNTGSGILTLQPISIVGSDFSMTSANFTAGQTLAVNASVTFTVAMKTTTAGTKSGTLSFLNDDADESPFNVTLSGAVIVAATGTPFIDDGDTGFALSGGWSTVVNYGYNGDARAATGTDGTKKATWTFGGLPAGQYRIETTWLPGSDRANAAPYVFRDGVGGALVGTAVVNQRLAPSGAASAGSRPFAALGTVTITGDTLVVELSNTATNGTIIADALRIVNVSPPPNTPEIDVLDGSQSLMDGASFDFGQVAQGTNVTKTFTVKNIGTADLILQPVAVSGSAFSLISANFIGGQILSPNSTASITVAMNTSHLGTFTGGINFSNSDSDEGPFDLSFSGKVNAAGATVFILDDGEAGFTLTGAWNNVAGYGYGSDAKSAAGSNGANTARWSFTGLTAGEYKIATTWLPGSDRASNAPYTIRDGVAGPVLSTVSTNQRTAPSGSTGDGGRPFASLGTVVITGSSLVIELANAGTDGAIIADAVRIERVTAAPNTPRIDVTDGTNTLIDGGAFHFGSTTQGAPALTRTITVKNMGTADLILQPISVTGTAFSLVSANFIAGQTLAPNATAVITLQLNPATIGTFSGVLSFGHNDGGPFDLALTGTINAALPAGIALIDDGDSGFSTTGTWGNVAGYGYGSDARTATGSDGSKKATWNFTGLATGTYQISTTWLPGSDRASNAPYVIREGMTGSILTSVNVNQRNAPSGAASGGGRPFSTIGTVTISGDSLVVELSNAGTNGTIIADAIRITKIA